MNYISTRNKSLNFDFSSIFLRGLAPDGGLFLPNEIKKFSEKELKEVNALLNKAFREIKKNNKFIGIKNNDEAIFYFQNEKVLETDNSEFIKIFFDIWLRENSQNPKFTQELLGKN